MCRVYFYGYFDRLWWNCRGIIYIWICLTRTVARIGFTFDSLHFMNNVGYLVVTLMACIFYVEWFLISFGILYTDYYYYYYYHYHYTIWMSLVTGLFFLILLLNQRWTPPLRLQASHCSAFRLMCDVPSTAVFGSESIECFPSTASKFFLKLLVTIPVAPIITGIIVHFIIHIRCISIHKLLYCNVFSSSFCTTFLSEGIATSISVHGFSFLFLIIISVLFAVTSLSVCSAWFHNTVTFPSSYTGLDMGVYHLSVVSMTKVLHIE